MANKHRKSAQPPQDQGEPKAKGITRAKLQACLPKRRRHYLRIIPRRKIRAFADAVARRFRPERIVLFGSYAYGRPTRDSDVDLLVVMPEDRRHGRKAVQIRQEVDADFPLDLIVRTPEDIEWRLAEGDCFLQEILSKGKVMYEAAHA